MGGTVTVLVGTTKGAFLIEGDAARRGWGIRGPLCDGWPINHVVGDPESGTIWAAGGGNWNGAGVWRSTDDGETWELSLLSNGQFDQWLAADEDFRKMVGRGPFPDAPFKGEVDAIWSLHHAHGRLYAGAKPGALFVSDDGGESWHRVQGLSDHPSHGSWQPGAAGLTLHSIVSDPHDPQKMWVGISAAGVFATEDGGATWERRNRRSNVAAPDHPPHPAAGDAQEIGHCVHNMARGGGDGGGLLYQQNHHGVFRSTDGGRSWDDITGGLPSTFGFPIAVHPDDPQMAWVLPLNGDSAGRYPPDASAAVWRTADGGENWQKMQEGLPAKDCFFTVLRQAMATDRASPAGVYFGTNSGSVFASRDEGETWDEIARHLPTVLCVETLHRA